MLLFDIGPVYIKACILFDKNNSNYLKIEENKSKLQYFDFKIKNDFLDKYIYYFKINLFKISIFSESFDHKLITSLKTEETAHYSGHIDQKLENTIKELFKIDLIKLGHTNQLSVYGLEYIANNIENSFFELPGQSILDIVQVGKELNQVTKKNYIDLKDSLFPLVFANIIEGTSMYRAESVDKIERIGGTTLGASTYWNLVSLCCDYEDPEEAVKDAIKGNNELIDLSVGDIYGGSYEQFGLNSCLIASSFGKLKYVNDIKEVKKEDISRSLLTLLCVTTSQMTALLAKTHSIDKIIILGNPFESLEFLQMIQMATNYFSQDSVKSYFSDYSPYINLIGMLRLLNI
jgi:pantothenate kinase